MAVLPKLKEKAYSWYDYQSWGDDYRWEVINGEAFAMSPAPLIRHQRIFSRLHLQLAPHFQGERCELFLAPTDVKFSEVDIVQPDLLVICDRDKIRETHIDGSPDLVIEIISPASVRHDRLRKTQLYSRYGVNEYWIVTPYPSLVEVLALTGEHYQIAGVYTKDDTFASVLFPGLKIDLKPVFDLPIPDNERIDEIRESTPPYGGSKD